MTTDKNFEHISGQSLTSLRRRWLLFALLYGVTAMLGYWLLVRQSGWAVQWLELTILTMALQLGVLWWLLRHNHRPVEAKLLPFLGYGNSLTLARGLCTCLLAGFLFAPPPLAPLAWVPALLYTLERVIDYFDGYLARITKMETKLGAILDIEFDGLGLLIAIALGIQYGKLPAWYLVLGLARQLFVLGMWLRRRWQLPVLDLPPSDYRRLIAGFQTGFISVMLWPVLSAQITLLASTLFALPLLYSFGRDWLVISTVLDAEATAYQTTRQTLKQLFEGWLPLAARLLGALLVLRLLWREAFTFPQWSLYLTGSEAHASSALWVALGLFWALMALLLLAGIMGRVAALALFALAALDILATQLTWTSNGLLLICAIIVIHLGSGHFALWQPEEQLIRLKLGVAQTPR
jgi:CDP-diacylglycerol---glycerol-3-phosphate 3-phosphatidyltransferase